MIRNLPITDLATELQSKNLTHTDANIWDVCDNQAYAKGHIEGATNHPINQPSNHPIDQGVSAETLNATSGTVYVLCGGGSKAPRAAEQLNEIDNSRDIVILMGGTRGAVAAGMTILTDK